MPKADDILKWVSILPIIASIVGGTIAFFVQRNDDIARLEQEARASELKAKKSFLDKQFKLYLEAVQIASRLATDTSPDRNQDVLRFEQLYWGQLGMVEDGRVSDAMTLVRKAYGAKAAARRSDGTPAGERASKCGDNLADASLMLSHCIRKSLEKSWDVKFQAGANDLCTNMRIIAVSKTCPDRPDGWQYDFRNQGFKG